MAKKTNCTKNGKDYYRISITIGRSSNGKLIRKEFYGSSKKEAEKKRDEYLSALDGFLSGGHHQQYNSIIIRISDELTATQQKELTEVIYDLLITN